MSAFPLGKEKQNKKITTKVNQFKATAQGSQYALKKKKKRMKGASGGNSTEKTGKSKQ